MEQEIIQDDEDFKIIEHADIAVDDDNLGKSNRHTIKIYLDLASLRARGGGGGGDGGDHPGHCRRPDCQGH